MSAAAPCRTLRATGLRGCHRQRGRWAESSHLGTRRCLQPAATRPRGRPSRPPMRSGGTRRPDLLLPLPHSPPPAPPPRPPHVGSPVDARGAERSHAPTRARRMAAERPLPSSPPPPPPPPPPRPPPPSPLPPSPTIGGDGGGGGGGGGAQPSTASAGASDCPPAAAPAAPSPPVVPAQGSAAAPRKEVPSLSLMGGSGSKGSDGRARRHSLRRGVVVVGERTLLSPLWLLPPPPPPPAHEEEGGISVDGRVGGRGDAGYGKRHGGVVRRFGRTGVRMYVCTQQWEALGCQPDEGEGIARGVVWWPRAMERYAGGTVRAMPAWEPRAGPLAAPAEVREKRPGCTSGHDGGHDQQDSTAP